MYVVVELPLLIQIKKPWPGLSEFVMFKSLKRRKAHLVHFSKCLSSTLINSRRTSSLKKDLDTRCMYRIHVEKMGWVIVWFLAWFLPYIRLQRLGLSEAMMNEDRCVWEWPFSYLDQKAMTYLFKVPFTKSRRNLVEPWQPCQSHKSSPRAQHHHQ